jgi:iron complex transport system substrate-binding protein
MKRLLLACALLLSAQSIAIAAPAARIVSLAPNLTELAFAAGAGARVVGTVEYSDYPAAARAIPRIGDAFRVDFERVVALRPDAVLVWEPGTPAGVVQRLKDLRLNVVTIKTHKLVEIGDALRTLGDLADSKQVADVAAQSFEKSIEQLRRQYGNKPTISVFLQVNDRPLYTVNGKQIMSEVLALCGGRNVFAELNELAPQVGVEAVIAANPQMIVVTGDAQTGAIEQWKRWPQMTAVRAHNVVQVPADDLARSTPRLAEGAQLLCRQLETGRERLSQLQSHP